MNSPSFHCRYVSKWILYIFREMCLLCCTAETSGNVTEFEFYIIFLFALLSPWYSADELIIRNKLANGARDMSVAHERVHEFNIHVAFPNVWRFKWLTEKCMLLAVAPVLIHEIEFEIQMRRIEPRTVKNVIVSERIVKQCVHTLQSVNHLEIRFNEKSTSDVERSTLFMWAQHTNSYTQHT